MQFHRLVLAAAVAAVASHAAPAQTAVSMSVTSSIGTVGYAGELFQCPPNQTLANLGETLMVNAYGVPSTPYILFVGTPSTYCQPLAGFAGEIAMAPPIFTIKVGTLMPDPAGSDLGSDWTKYPLPGYLPLGVQLRLQILSVAGDGPAFARATEVHTR